MLKRWELVEYMIKENYKIHKKVKIVIVVHGESEETNKRLKDMWVIQHFEIPRQRVPLTFSNRKTNTNKLNMNRHARHMSACAKGKIRMFIINTNIEENQEKVQKTKRRTKRKGAKRKGTKDKKKILKAKA